MSEEKTREIVMRYLTAEHEATSLLAEDVVFTVMGSGEESHGPSRSLVLSTTFIMLPLMPPHSQS